MKERENDTAPTSWKKVLGFKSVSGLITAVAGCFHVGDWPGSTETFHWLCSLVAVK